MLIDSKTRKKLIAILDGIDYRKIISGRVGCHPNTVSNVLLNGNNNERVELELLVLAKEIQDERDPLRKKALAIVKQL